MRFTPSPSSFTASDSSCFSPAPSGLFNVSACQRNAPLLLSWPHFYGADPGLQEKVHLHLHLRIHLHLHLRLQPHMHPYLYLKLHLQIRGLSPSQAEHELQVDVIPSLGVGLRAAIRLQINLHIQSASLNAGLTTQSTLHTEHFTLHTNRSTRPEHLFVCVYLDRLTAHYTLHTVGTAVCTLHTSLPGPTV